MRAPNNTKRIGGGRGGVVNKVINTADAAREREQDVSARSDRLNKDFTLKQWDKIRAHLSVIAGADLKSFILSPDAERLSYWIFTFSTPNTQYNYLQQKKNKKFNFFFFEKKNFVTF